MLAATVVISLAVAADSAEAAPVVVAPADVRSEGARALEEAQQSDKRVEIESRTTESQQVFANPSGTFTLEQTPGPVRVRRGSTWVPVDTTLLRHSDGTVRPTATSIHMEFSGGGATSPMARIAQGGRILALRWSQPLPEPVLEGDTATYREVLPGVDLQIRAHADAFSEVLVVKTAEAASQPALRRLRFGAIADGGSLRATPAGGFQVVDAAGGAVFESPEPVMWDSNGSSAARVSRLAGDPAADRTRAPQEGDRTAPMKVEVSADSVTVVPDNALLRGGKFPLYLDPSVYAAKLTARGMVNRSFPNTAYFNWNNAAHEGMGYTTREGTHLKRLLWRFDTRGIHGKTILKATFSAFEVWSDSCTATPVILGLTRWWDATSTWNRQPAWMRQLGPARTVAYGRPGCTPGGAWVEFDAKSAAAEAASARWSATSLMLRAVNETNSSGWKRFRWDGAFAARLSIEYNSPPATPSNPRTTSPATACVTGAGRPIIPGADAPTLVARMNDADTAQSVIGQFELWVTNGSRIGNPYKTPPKKPNVDYSVQLPTLPAGTYSWRSQAFDGIAWSPHSRWCEFTVDPDKPASPTVTVPEGQEYAVGNIATFTFGNGGSADVAKYRWSFNDVPTSADVPTTSATVSIRLGTFGPNTLRVWSYDKAGNRSELPGALDVTILGGRPTGHWKLDEGVGNTTADSLAPSRPIALKDHTWTDGRWYADDPANGDPTDRGVAFDGAATVGQTGAAEIIRTDLNFSVSTWVRPGDLGGRRVIASQGESATKGFTLSAAPAGVDENGHRLVSYQFALPNSDASAPPDRKEAVARSEAMSVVPGEWVLVTGVYESGSKLMTLYVGRDNAAEAEVAFSPVHEAGAVRLGRAQAGTSPEFWLGDIDDFRLFTGALDEEQVRQIYAEERTTR